MSKLIGEYTAAVTGLMQTIAKEEEENILKAADLLSDKVNEGRLINIFGAGGHSAIAAMEIFRRGALHRELCGGRTAVFPAEKSARF